MKKSFETQYFFYKQPDYPQKIEKKIILRTFPVTTQLIIVEKKTFVHSPSKQKKNFKFFYEQKEKKNVFQNKMRCSKERKDTNAGIIFLQKKKSNIVNVK